MRGLVITNKYAQPLVIKRLGMDRSCLADSNKLETKTYAKCLRKNIGNKRKIITFALLKYIVAGNRHRRTIQLLTIAAYNHKSNPY